MSYRTSDLSGKGVRFTSIVSFRGSTDVNIAGLCLRDDSETHVLREP